MRASFGEFVLDDVERRLYRGEVPVHLTPKAYALLCYLVEQGPRALSKAEIRERIWPSTFVSDDALTSVIKEIRHALGDDPREPRYIRGVRSFGYAFCGEPNCRERDSGLLPSQPPPSPPAAPGEGLEFRVIWRSRELALHQGENVLGRTHEADIWVEDTSVSRRHAILRLEGREVTLEDCDSKNGTFVGGQRVRGRQPLRPGEKFWLGSVCLILACYERHVSTRTAVPPPDLVD